MKKLFYFPYFKDTLKRLRTFTVVMLVLSVISVITSLSGHYLLLSEYMKGSFSLAPTHVLLGDINSCGALFSSVLAPIVTVASFSYMTKRSESDFYEALPVSRRARAVTGMIASATSVIFVIFTSTVVALLGILPCVGKVATVGFGISMLQLLGYVLITILAVSVATLAVSVTGTTRMSILVSFAVLFAPRIILACINGAVNMLDVTLVSGHIIPLFDNNYNLLTASLVGNTEVFTSPAAFVYTVILTGAYAVSAVLLFERRPGEVATRAFVPGPARRVFIILISTVIAALGFLVVFIGDFFVVLGIFVLVISAVVYLASSLVLCRGERKGRAGAISLASFVGVSLLMLCTVLSASAILGAYSPDKDRIKHVSVVGSSDDFDYVFFSEYVFLQSEGIKLDSAQTREAVAAALDRGYDVRAEDYTELMVKIRTWSGYTYRHLYLTDAEHAAIFDELGANEEYRALWTGITDSESYCSISVSSGYVTSGELLSALRRDAERMGYDRWCAELTGDSEFIDHLEISTIYKGRTLRVSLPMTVNMTETYSVYSDLYRSAVEEELSSVRARLEAAASGEGEPITLYANYTDSELNFRTVYIEFSEGTEDASVIIDTLLGFVSLEPKGDMLLCIEISDNSLFGEYSFYYYDVADGIEEKTVIDFFKKYGDGFDGKL